MKLLTYFMAFLAVWAVLLHPLSKTCQNREIAPVQSGFIISTVACFIPKSCFMLHPGVLVPALLF